MAAVDPTDRAVLDTKHRGLVMGAVIAVTLCQFLDATIANVALPYMQAALGASSDSVSWVLTSFIIATAIATPITGWLSDRIGSRQLFLLSTITFLVSSAACGAAYSLPTMIAFRIVQGISAAFIGPMTQTILFDINPPSKQGTSMAIFGMAVMVAPICGPVLGGYLTEYLNWRWIFYINLPIGIPALAILWWGLPSRPIEKRKLDLTGFIALGLGLGAMQLMLDRGQHRDWLHSWEIIGEGIIALSAFWIFFVHTATVKEPLFRRELFANRQFLFGCSFMMVMGISVVGLSALLPTLFQSLYGYSVIDSGAVTAPRGLGVMMTSFLASNMIKRHDYRWVIFTGYLVAAFGMWTMTSWSLEMEKTPIYLALMIQGMGMGMIVMPMNMMSFSTLPHYLRPEGSSLLSLFRSLGGSVGISILVTVLSREQQINHAEIGAHVTANSLPSVDLPSAVERFPGFGSGTMMAINGEVSRQATMIAFLDCFYLLGIMLLVIAPTIFLLKAQKLGKAGEKPVIIE